MASAHTVGTSCQTTLLRVLSGPSCMKACQHEADPDSYVDFDCVLSCRSFAKYMKFTTEAVLVCQK